ncbi:MAG: NAD(P)(+) transhydrogenase (Re/Si-specific) subunit alpha, partial [Roseinatronobacter sp.]|nr:NAD(P)(+) transhydrogenase (Re/Si-specific) subunit alpha [Roseinatronobacter sp.]
MKVGALKEIRPGEARVALTPDSATQIQKLGHACFVQSGAGLAAGFSDALYEQAGVTVVADAAALCEAVDVVIKVREPELEEVNLLREGQTLISFF